MEKGIAKLFIQLFADESETTDLEMDVEEVEYTDSVNEETEETSEPVEEPTEEPEKVKTFTQEEVNNMIRDRLTRERNNLDRKYKDELSKYEELAYLTQKGLKAESLEETLEKSRSFYGKQGITYTQVRNTRDEEILADADVSMIIDSSDNLDDIESEIKRILAKGNNVSTREKIVAEKLIRELETRQELQELAKIGVKPEEYNSKEFIEFKKKFNMKETSIGDIYELYSTKNKSTRKVENPGSMKSIPAKEKKKYITEAEYDRMTDKEIEENMDLIKESMLRW